MKDALVMFAIWVGVAACVWAVASCTARIQEAKYKALTECEGTCVY